MRHLALAVCLLAAVAVRADRLLFIPTGKKLPQGTVRGEWLFDGGDRERNRFYLGAGITKNIEFEFLTFSPPRSGQSRLDSMNVSYNYVDPVVGFVPGITLGVRDLFDRSEGRAFFVATTYKIGLDGLYNSDTPAELTLGLGTKPYRGAFVGVTLPFTATFRIIGEHDSRDLRAGFEFKPHRDLAFRWFHQEQGGTWSLSWTRRL
ncbi:MAG: hypothetical protein KIS66_15320 [Fimbriimonadaceae bacterium]|nr:hypothetical protein [Fimbriimonadaceae bacterium]